MTDLLRRVFPPAPQRPIVPPGITQRMTADPPGAPRRLHLRVEPDGRGVLIINAATVLHLNEAAAAHAWLMIEGRTEPESAEWIARRFRTSKGRAMKDARLLRERVETLAAGDEYDPVAVLGLEREEPFAHRPSAPYRLDVALTYRMLDGVSIDPRARRRVDRELDGAAWIAALDQAWSAGVPHVIFVGGEPTIRPDLLELVRHAEALGQVSGVVTAGEAVADSTRLDGLVSAGLDHLLVVVEPAQVRSLEGLKKAVAADVFCAAHWTIDPENMTNLGDSLKAIRTTGVTHISLSAHPGPEAATSLGAAAQAVAEADLALVWDLPVPFSGQNPIRFEQGLSPESGAWLYVEPDGDVLVAIDAPDVLGNITRDSIVEMWQRARRTTSPTTA
jgi:hypothetical protein